MNNFSRVIIFLLISVSVARSQTSVPVFVSGEEGHESYRIPAIIGLKNGDLLAFAEGRMHDAGDFGDINLVMKRSTDKGNSWSALTTIVDNDSLQAGNPAPVVDMMDPQYPDGRIFLFYNTGNNHEGEVRKGKGLREVWYITSADDGNTWSPPVNITTQVHRPRQPHLHSDYNFPEDWRSYANTPGHALQLTDGKYRGRIFVPANHSAGDPREDFSDYAAHGFFTDDHGKSFHLGESVNVKGSNESTATNLADGTLMMNMRNQHGDVRARLVALSRTGGQRWDTTYFDKRLPDPICEGSILTIGKKKGKNIIAFSNAADTENRDNLSVHISFDDGKTWAKNIVVDKAPSGQEKNHAAYSDLVKLGRKEIGILYESKDYARIVFTAVRWKP
ncbi:MAG: sialidase family protein [Chryseosolibacter sp.]